VRLNGVIDIPDDAVYVFLPHVSITATIAKASQLIIKSRNGDSSSNGDFLKDAYQIERNRPIKPREKSQRAATVFSRRRENVRMMITMLPTGIRIGARSSNSSVIVYINSAIVLTVSTRLAPFFSC
jgi:hypothetical protein